MVPTISSKLIIPEFRILLSVDKNK